MVCRTIEPGTSKYVIFLESSDLLTTGESHAQNRFVVCAESHCFDIYICFGVILRVTVLVGTIVSIEYRWCFAFCSIEILKSVNPDHNM